MFPYIQERKDYNGDRTYAQKDVHTQGDANI
jgi:hypothetical protein